MSEEKEYARKAICAMQGYVPGEQPQGIKLVKLNTNENPYPPSPKVKEAIEAFDYRKLRLYSDPNAKLLREAVAQVYSVKEEQVMCGNGSDELLTIALRTFVGEGEAFAYTEPSYSLYPVLAGLQGAVKCPVQLDENFDLPEDAAALAGDAKLFILACPNAPTGNLLSEERIHKLCREFSGVVWVDEAYADFAGWSFISQIDKYDNVVVSRTFSKSYSLAGLRMGFTFANAALTFEMNKVRDSYNIDFLAQVIARAAVLDEAYMKSNARKIRETRDWLSAKLVANGCKVLPSQANFIFVQPKHEAAEIFAALRQRGYLVRYFSLPRISQYMRVTIGTRGDMEGFCETFLELDK